MSEPHDGNRDHFEGLASLSAALRADPRLAGLAAYCELQELGLRRPALAQLEAFLAEARSHDVLAQRDLALRVLEAHWKTPQAHQFLADPLRRRFVEPVLEEWRATEADNPAPVRQLGLLRRDRALLDEALRLNPNDDAVRAAIAGLLIAP